MKPMYVKTGLAGYGPELDPEDEPCPDVETLCAAIHYELGSEIDGLYQWRDAAYSESDAKTYMLVNHHVEWLEYQRANFDYDHRKDAPLFSGSRDVLDAVILGVVAAEFPLPLDPDGNRKLYVWEAE